MKYIIYNELNLIFFFFTKILIKFFYKSIIELFLLLKNLKKIKKVNTDKRC